MKILSETQIRAFLKTLSEYEKTYLYREFKADYGYKLDTKEWTKEEYGTWFIEKVLDSRESSKKWSVTKQNFKRKVSEMFVKGNMRGQIRQSNYGGA